jgi:uncharacterized protein
MDHINQQSSNIQPVSLLIEQKYLKLKELIKEMGSVLVALSGGVDSVFLVQVANEVLGEKALAVTCDSASFPKEEKELAIRLSIELGFRHILVETKELENENYASNPANRCYFCRVEMYDTLDKIAKEQDCNFILDGFNFSDQGDYRPGRMAATERKVRSPLFEAELTKEEIRVLANRVGLPNWDRPASACLSSRIPYGSRVTLEKLKQIEDAEIFLHSRGFRQIRVRHHDQIARLETDPREIQKFFKNGNQEKIVTKLKEIGFLYVTLDLQGYRTGSLNEEL